MNFLHYLNQFESPESLDQARAHAYSSGCVDITGMILSLMHIIYVFSCKNGGVFPMIFIQKLKNKKIMLYAFKNAAFQ